jgi:hypothetical protein
LRAVLARRGLPGRHLSVPVRPPTGVSGRRPDHGEAAELAGVPRADFIDELARRKIDVFQVDFEDLKAETGLG